MKGPMTFFQTLSRWQQPLGKGLGREAKISDVPLAKWSLHFIFTQGPGMQMKKVLVSSMIGKLTLDLSGFGVHPGNPRRTAS